MDASTHASARPPGWLLPALLLLYALFLMTPFLLASDTASDRLDWRYALANGLGMAGFALLLAEFILSGRFRSVTGPIGIDLTLRFHQLMGHTVLLLLLLHPYVYALVPASPYPGSTTPTPDPFGGVTGMIAWLILFSVVLLAIGRDSMGLRYETWRITHGIGAGLVAIFGLHHTLTTGTYTTENPWLAGFWIAATGVALLTLLHVYVLLPLRQARAPWKLVSVERAGPGYWTLTLEPEAGSAAAHFRFLAGQFAWLKLRERPWGVQDHPFSIASAPEELPRVRFTIKEAGDFTRNLDRFQPGQRAWLDGPHGHFVLEDGDTAGYVLIAGGVGIAPILSLLRALRARGEQRPIVLLYANRDADEALYTEELETAQQELDLRVIRVADRPEGHEGVEAGPITEERLRAWLPAEGTAHWAHYICGPPGMIDAVEAALERLGVPLARIHSERFRYSYSARTRRARRTLLVWLLLSVLAAGAAALLGWSAV